MHHNRLESKDNLKAEGKALGWEEDGMGQGACWMGACEELCFRVLDETKLVKIFQIFY